MSEMIYPEESCAILGGCFSVYNEKGSGFLEPIYQECLEIEFDFLQIPYESQKPLEISYRGKVLKKKYEPDFICYGKVIVEIKAVSQIVDEHRAQVLNYLNATQLDLALLVNFGHHRKLEYERLVRKDRRDNYARE